MGKIIKTDLKNFSELLNVLLKEKQENRKSLIVCNSKFDREFLTVRLEETSLKLIVFGSSRSKEDENAYLSGNFDVMISSLSIISTGYDLSSIPTFIFYHLGAINDGFYRAHLKQLLAKLYRQEIGHLYLASTSIPDEFEKTPDLDETISLLEASCQALSLLKGEKEFEHDLTLYGPGGMNVVRIQRVIRQLEQAIANSEEDWSPMIQRQSENRLYRSNRKVATYRTIDPIKKEELLDDEIKVW